MSTKKKKRISSQEKKKREQTDFDLCSFLLLQTTQLSLFSARIHFSTDWSPAPGTQSCLSLLLFIYFIILLGNSWDSQLMKRQQREEKQNKRELGNRPHQHNLDFLVSHIYSYLEQKQILIYFLNGCVFSIINVETTISTFPIYFLNSVEEILCHLFWTTLLPKNCLILQTKNTITKKITNINACTHTHRGTQI